ncbi:hypothetical protein [Methanococcus sp. CF]
MPIDEVIAGVVAKKGFEIALRISGKKYEEYMQKSSFIDKSQSEFHKIIKFKKGNQPKIDSINDALRKFLKKYNYDKNNEILELMYNSKVADAALGYYLYSEVVYTPELLENWDENLEMDVEDIYDSSIVDDLTMTIIPNLQGKNKEEIKKIIYKIYEYFDDLEKTLRKDYFINSSELRMNLIFSEKNNAEKFKKEMDKKLNTNSHSKIGNLEENMDKKMTISIRNPDQIFIEKVLKNNIINSIKSTFLGA